MVPWLDLTNYLVSFCLRPVGTIVVSLCFFLLYISSIPGLLGSLFHKWPSSAHPQQTTFLSCPGPGRRSFLYCPGSGLRSCFSSGMPGIIPSVSLALHYCMIPPLLLIFHVFETVLPLSKQLPLSQFLFF